MDSQLFHRLQQCQSLPTLPAVAVQVLELVRQPSCQIPQLARVISKDPALASRILRTVNSSIYARPKKISRLTQALTLLGLQTVRVLALGFSLAHNLKNYKNKGFRALDFWRRSVYTATAALTLAQRMHLEMLEEAFIAGLLTDVGMLALHALSPADYDSISDRARTHADLLKLEQSTFSTNHAEIGGALAQLWQLPDTLAIPVAHHHTPDAVEDPALRQLAEICQIAGRCADVFVEQSAASAIDALREFGHTHLHLDDAQCDGLLEQISRRTGEIAPLFDVHLNTDLSVEEILKRANESVIQLNLESQRRQQLHEPPPNHSSALVDRTAFESTLTAALKDPSHPHALLLISVDHFSRMRHEHGLKLADSMMNRLPTFFADLAQPPNLAAQFHEDQFAILLSNTDRHRALARAEALRRTIHESPLDFGRLTIPVTVCIGVAATEPTFPFSAAQLIKAADLALDSARHSGHNRVRALSLTQPAAA